MRYTTRATHRPIRWGLAASIALVWIGAIAACPAPDPTQPAPAVDDPTAPSSTPVPDPVPDPPLPAETTSFRQKTWLVDALAIALSTDVDGDGVQDNKLPEVLDAIDALVGTEDLSTAQVNANIASNIAQSVTIVFLDGNSDGESMTLDVLAGTVDETTLDFEVDPASYDENGEPTSRMEGAFYSETRFDAAGDITLQVTMQDGLAPVQLPFEDVRFDALLEEDFERLDARMFGTVPLTRLIDDAIGPLVPAEGIELSPGNVLSRDELIAVLHDLAPGLSDVETSTGELGITGAFTIIATEAP
jgi:hypothetical protein